MKLILLMAVIGVAVIIVQSICSDVNEECRRYDNQDLMENENV